MNRRAVFWSLALALGLSGPSSSLIAAGGRVPERPTCAETLTEWCTDNTALGPASCFRRAADRCGAKELTYADCVVRNAEYCQTKTSLNDLVCFDEANKACRPSWLERPSGGTGPAVAE
jgi:hypothetical protein